MMMMIVVVPGVIIVVVVIIAGGCTALNNDSIPVFAVAIDRWCGRSVIVGGPHLAVPGAAAPHVSAIGGGVACQGGRRPETREASTAVQR